MSLDLPQLIETAADEVASVGRAAAGSINELVHDWGHETRELRQRARPVVAGRAAVDDRGRDASPLRWLIPIAVLGVVAARRAAPPSAVRTPQLPDRDSTQTHLHETVTASSPKEKRTRARARRQLMLDQPCVPMPRGSRSSGQPSRVTP